jgi:hypothetical protein
MSDPSSAAVVLHSDLGYLPTFYLHQVWTGPLSPDRVEISTCIRLHHRPPLLLYFVLFLYYQRKESLTTFLCFYTCVGKESLVVDEGVREPS